MCVVLPPDSFEELCKSGNGVKYMLGLFSEKVVCEIHRFRFQKRLWIHVGSVSFNSRVI